MAVPLSHTLRQLALVALIRGDNRETASLEQAATAIDGYGPYPDGEVERYVRGGRAAMLPGIDETAANRLRDILLPRGRPALEAALETIPRDIRKLLQTSALSLPEAADLGQRFGITTSGELSTALQEGLLRDIPGFDEARLRSLGRLLRGWHTAERMSLGRAYGTIEPVLRTFQSACPTLEFLSPVGSLRRFEPTVGDLPLVAAGPDATAIVDCFLALPEVVQIRYRGPSKASVRLESAQVDLFVVPPERLGPALVHHTGSVAHTLKLRQIAGRRGLVLASSSLTDRQRVIETPTERSVYAALGLEWMPPEMREDAGEVEAAMAGELPSLVTRSDIRGDFHMHSIWSDGRDSIELMARTALALGYEYIAITDHSPNSGASRSLDPDTLLKQIDEVASVRERVPGLTILHGCEVDILGDGRLDFPDTLLERLDLVLASLHSGAGQPGDWLTRRYIAAMNHPLVSIVTHPTNRLIGHRPGYDLDFDRLFEAAVATGTILEIDGAPVHLDLDGRLARAAVAAGVMVAIDSDGHRADLLERQMIFGVATARRGWVGAAHVLNTRPLAEVRRILARKKR